MGYHGGENFNAVDRDMVLSLMADTDLGSKKTFGSTFQMCCSHS